MKSFITRLLLFTALLFLLHSTPLAQPALSVTQRCYQSRPIKINPPTLFSAAPVGYSQIGVDAVTLTARFAGQASLDVNMTLRGTTLKEQAAFTVSNIDLALSAVEAERSDILHSVIYVVNYNKATDLPIIVNLANSLYKP
eukprot:IDg20676t1